MLGPLIQRHAALRAIVAVLPTAAVVVLQFELWPLFEPYAWFMFVPAVFLTAWLGGFAVGVANSAVTTFLVWWLFVPPEGSLAKEPRFLVPALTFFSMGVVFSELHRRLRGALADVRAKNAEVTRLYEKTRDLDALKTQLFANVSHELRTPLSLVLGETERLLGSTTLDASSHESLETVARNARVLLRHVDELLDVAKLEAERVAPRRVELDVARFARDLAGSFATVAQERRVALTVDTPGTLVAELDPEHLESVLTNLLSNALKFTPGGGRVRLGVATEGDGESRIVIEVADSGPGIPADKREAVFERFRQLDGGSTRAAGGTGLGLAIARDFVALHGGTITADAAPEGGALVRVDLPRHAPSGALVHREPSGEVHAKARQLAEELRPEPPRSDHRPTATQPIGREDGALLLIVEDSPEMSRFLCEALAEEHRIVSAFDGEEGLAKALSLRPDLVLTDVMMPRMSGDELVRAMRRAPALRDTPVIVLTAKADLDLRLDMLEEGALDYLTKPFSTAELRARIRKTLERARIEQALGQSRADLDRAQSVARIGSWRLDVRRDELVWSDESYHIFGIPPGTPLTYEKFLERVHPDDRAFVDRMWTAALSGAPYDIEHRIVVDGEVKCVRERAELAFDEQGRLLGGIGVTQDITDRKRIEDALRAAEQEALDTAQRLRKLLDASMAVSDAVASLPETSVSAVMGAIAAQARTLLGAEYAAIGLGSDPEQPFDPWIQVGVHPEIARRVGRAPRPVGTLGLAWRDHREARVRDVRQHPAFRGFPPGHPVMTSFLGVQIRFRGAPVGTMYLANKRGADEFTAEDQQVAELLAARAGGALEAAQLYANEATERAWMQTVVDQMPEGVLLIDARGVVTVENQTLLALSRPEAHEHDELGNPIRLDLRLPSGERVPASDLPYVQALRDGTSFSSREHAVRRSDGRLVPVLVSVSPVTGTSGERAGAVMIVQDITYLKELERMREEWTSIVAHDLRQPVSAISMHAALLGASEHLPEEKRRRSIETIRSSVKSLDRMIEDLLDASRVDARRLSVDRRDTSVGALVRDVLERSPELARCCELTIAAGADRPVLADPVRVEQVLRNLLSNAEKYGEPGRPIHVALTPREGELQVTVTNHGAGISSDELPRLFGRFERLRMVGRGIPGIGLGLYICKGLVEAQGGRIWAESTPGETTSFHFTLPFAPRPRAAPQARA